MEKKYIRFIANTKDHERGEKIKALNIITKVFDEDGKLLEIKKPHLAAGENQIEIDIEGLDYKQYLPLHHFKCVDNKIIKKTQEEIDAIEASITAEKSQKQALLAQRTQDIQDAKKIINDITKTDAEKLNALIQVLKEGNIL